MLTTYTLAIAMAELPLLLMAPAAVAGIVLILIKGQLASWFEPETPPHLILVWCAIFFVCLVPWLGLMILRAPAPPPPMGEQRELVHDGCVRMCGDRMRGHMSMRGKNTGLICRTLCTCVILEYERDPQFVSWYEAVKDNAYQGRLIDGMRDETRCSQQARKIAR